MPTQVEIDGLSVMERLELLERRHQRQTAEADRQSAERDQRRHSFHQWLDSVGIAFGVVFTAANLIATAMAVRTAQEDLRTSQESRVTDRYAKTVEALGSDDPSVRVGALHGLGRLMTDSPRDRDTITAVLAAYALQHDPKPDMKTPLASDFQAALTVLGNRPTRDCSAKGSAANPVVTKGGRPCSGHSRPSCPPREMCRSRNGAHRAMENRGEPHGSGVHALLPPNLKQSRSLNRPLSGISGGTPRGNSVVVETDRCRITTTSVKGQMIDAWYSGKTAASAATSRTSPALTGCCCGPVRSSARRRRRYRSRPPARLPALYPLADVLPVLADPGHQSAGHGVIVPFAQPTDGNVLSRTNRTHNALQRSLRCLGERGFALLVERWTALKHTSLSPGRLGDLVAAALVLTHFNTA